MLTSSPTATLGSSVSLGVTVTAAHTHTPTLSNSASITLTTSTSRSQTRPTPTKATPSLTVTVSPTTTPSKPTVSASPSRSISASGTATVSVSPSVSRPPTLSFSQSPSPSLTATSTLSATRSAHTASTSATVSLSPSFPTQSRSLSHSTTMSTSSSASLSASSTHPTVSRSLTASFSSSTSPSPSVTSSPTLSLTLPPTLTRTPSYSATASRTLTPSGGSATFSPSPSDTESVSLTSVTKELPITASLSFSLTETQSTSVTPPPTRTATFSVTKTASVPPTVTISRSVSASESLSASLVPTSSVDVSLSDSVVPTSSRTFSKTLRATDSLPVSESASLVPTPTDTLSESITATASESDSFHVSETRTVTPPPTPSPTMTYSDSSSITVTPPPTPTPSASYSASESESVTSSASPSESPSDSRSMSASESESSSASDLTPSPTLGDLHVLWPVDTTIVRGVIARDVIGGDPFDPNAVGNLPTLYASAIRDGQPVGDRTMTFGISGDAFATELPDEVKARNEQAAAEAEAAIARAVALGGGARRQSGAVPPNIVSIDAWILTCMTVKTVRAPSIRTQLGAIWQIASVYNLTSGRLELRFLEHPAFKLAQTEVFVLSFAPTCFASGLRPQNTEFAFVMIKERPQPPPTPEPAEDTLRSPAEAVAVIGTVATLGSTGIGGLSASAMGLSRVTSVQSLAACRRGRSRLTFVEHPTSQVVGMVGSSDTIRNSSDVAATANDFLGAMLFNSVIAVGFIVLQLLILGVETARVSCAEEQQLDDDMRIGDSVGKGEGRRRRGGVETTAGDVELQRRGVKQASKRRRHRSSGPDARSSNGDDDKPSPTTVAATATAFPSRTVVTLIFLPAVVKCGVFLFFSVDAAGALVVAFLLVMIWVLCFFGAGFVVIGPKFRGIYVRRMAWPRAPICTVGNLTWDYRDVFRARGKWADAHRAAAFMPADTNEQRIAAITAHTLPDPYVGRFGDLFGDFHGRAHYFLLIDALVAVVAGGLDGYAAASGSCFSLAIALLVLFSIYLLFLLVKRPFTVVANNVFFVIVAAVQVGMAALAVAHLRPSNDDGDGRQDYLEALIITAMVLQLALVVRALVDVVALLRHLVRRCRGNTAQQYAAEAFDAGQHSNKGLLPSAHDVFFSLMPEDPVFGTAAFPHPLVTAYDLQGGAFAGEFSDASGGEADGTGDAMPMMIPPDADPRRDGDVDDPDFGDILGFGAHHHHHQRDQRFDAAEGDWAADLGPGSPSPQRPDPFDAYDDPEVLVAPSVVAGRRGLSQADDHAFWGGERAPTTDAPPAVSPAAWRDFPAQLRGTSGSAQRTDERRGSPDRYSEDGGGSGGGAVPNATWHLDNARPSSSPGGSRRSRTAAAADLNDRRYYGGAFSQPQAFAAEDEYADLPPLPGMEGQSMAAVDAATTLPPLLGGLDLQHTTRTVLDRGCRSGSNGSPTRDYQQRSESTPQRGPGMDSQLPRFRFSEAEMRAGTGFQLPGMQTPGRRTSPHGGL